MAKGWHYTAKRNWLGIQKEGFIPYLISKPEIDELFDSPVRGIWTWKEKPTGLSELGSIMFQVATKQATEIVLLEFDYDEADLLSADGRNITVFHDGIMGDWMYHTRQPARIVTKSIPPEKIQIIKEVNLMDLVPPDLGVSVNDDATLDERLS